MPLASVPVPDVVTSPADDTVAIVGLDEVQVMLGFAMVFPPESLTMAVVVVVSPNEAKDKLVWFRVILAGVEVTMMETVVLIDPDVAVIVAVPTATLVTSPADDTVATLVSDEVHVTVTPVIPTPSASLTAVAIVCVAPILVNVCEAGDAVIVATAWSTVTLIVVLDEPALAVIAAVPLLTAAATPTDELDPAAVTITTLVSDEAQVTVAPVMAVPRESLTVASRIWVWPNDAKDKLLWFRVTDAAV